MPIPDWKINENLLNIIIFRLTLFLVLFSERLILNTIYFWDRFQIYMYIFFTKFLYNLLLIIDIPFEVLIQLWTYLYNVLLYKKEYRFTAIVGQMITFFKHYNAPYGATKWLLHNKNTNVFHISVTLIIKVLTEQKCG